MNLFNLFSLVGKKKNRIGKAYEASWNFTRSNWEKILVILLLSAINHAITMTLQSLIIDFKLKIKIIKT